MQAEEVGGQEAHSDEARHEALTVYVGMVGDGLHVGHLNLLKTASKLGRVIVGVLTDEAAASYKPRPLQGVKNRMDVIRSLKFVSEVVVQDTHDYRPNLSRIRPRYVVHGDDWIGSSQRTVRWQVIEWLSENGGELIEIPYTEGVSSTILKSAGSESANEKALYNSLSQAIASKQIVRAIEVHSGISASVVNQASFVEPGGNTRSYDALWMSSLVDSTLRAKVDNESVDLTSRLAMLDDIQNACDLPIIFDGDTGGQTDHFVSNFKILGRRGIDAVIIEDKVGLKQNSLYGTERPQVLDDPRAFSEKIAAGKHVQQRDGGPLIFARIESLIAGTGLDDALSRAKSYIEAGADGIMIHSRSKSPDEVYDFAAVFKSWNTELPLVAVPSSYSQVTAEDLSDRGFDVVIYANHLLRACIPVMERAANQILEDSMSGPLEDQIMSIQDILEYISDD